jgi:hypothetical protein
MSVANLISTLDAFRLEMDDGWNAAWKGEMPQKYNGTGQAV